MEPIIIASMISAAKDVGIAVFERWTSNKDGAKKIKKKIEFAKKHYNSIRRALSNNCIKVLKKLEDGQSKRAKELIVEIYTNHHGFSRDEQERLESEFDYRLYFMEQIGVITKPTREYFITELGILFLNEAREKKDYFKILFN